MIKLLVLADASLLVTVGNGLILLLAGGCGLYGWRFGLLKTTVLGFAILGSFVGALGAAEYASVILRHFDVPGSHVSWVAYVGMLGSLLAGSLVVSEKVLRDETWFTDGIISRLVSVGVGVVAGYVFAGSLLVAWTMVPLPRSLALRPRQLSYDAGEFALKVFAKCVEQDREKRSEILGGFSARSGPQPPCSEPFIDDNGNCVWEEGEPFVDCDGNSEFTLKGRVLRSTESAEESASWPLGILDQYWLGSWSPPTVLCAPRITSPLQLERTAYDVAQGLLYEATAVDQNACDEQQFVIEMSDPAITGAVIDQVSGVVTLSEDEVREMRKEYCFTLTVTDRAGLSESRKVVIKINQEIPREKQNPAEDD